MNSSQKQILVWVLICAIIITITYALVKDVDIEPPFFSVYNSGSTPQQGKSQWVRLLDIFVLGPVGLYIGYKIYKGESKDLEKIGVLGVLIILYGVGTILYNGGNYLAIQKEN